MRNTYFGLICCIIVFSSLHACSRSSEPPQPPDTEQKRISTHDNTTSQIDLTQLLINQDDIHHKFQINTSFYSNRELLKFLKKPSSSVEGFQQTFIDTTQQQEASKITMVVLKFPDKNSCTEEARINFSILRNILKKDNLAIDAFDINMFGEESMGLVFTGKKYPLYLYCRTGRIFIKLNGGKKRQMEELIKLLEIIDNKINSIKS